MMKRPKVTRRSVLKTAAATVAAPLVVPGAALGADDATAASERITMAGIGVGGRGGGNIRGASGRSEVQVLAVCDVVAEHRDRVKADIDNRQGNKDCASVNDFRDVLARDDIDAVMIGTPDHWHAIITIDACKAGKDVFSEKPETLTIAEGRAMVNAVRRYGRVFSGGSQRVLGDYGNWPKLVRGGALGEIREAFVSCGGPSGDCYLPEEPTPPGVDWDLWIGPAPYRPFHSQLIRGGFRPFRDYSGGGMTDWGAHRFGAATFAIGVHKTGPVEIIPPDGKDVKHLTYVYANGLRIYHGGTKNITYKGTRGELPGNPPPLEGEVDMEWYKGSGGLVGDFIYSVKNRVKAFRDIEIAHRACTVCHLGNLAYWLKRPLRWDPQKEVFLGDDEANRWLDRPKREPWTLS